MSGFLAIDVGNTHTVFALFSDSNLLREWRLTTDARRTEDEYHVLLLNLIQHADLAHIVIENVIIASVVPDTIHALKRFVTRHFKGKLWFVGQAPLDNFIKTRIKQESEVGADRLINAFAAYQKVGRAVIVVDFGTATTFDVIDEEGVYLGGMISPGIQLSLDALHHKAAKLPSIPIMKPEKAIGDSTVEAMQSGIYYGYIGLIEGSIAQIKAQMQQDAKVIATGGLAKLFSDSTAAIDEVDSSLTINGLYQLLQTIKEKEEVYEF